MGEFGSAIKGLIAALTVRERAVGDVANRRTPGSQALGNLRRVASGNRESLCNAFFSRQSILLWALKTHARNREKLAMECEFLAKEKRVVRLQSGRDVERFGMAA